MSSTGVPSTASSSSTCRSRQSTLIRRQRDTEPVEPSHVAVPEDADRGPVRVVPSGSGAGVQVGQVGQVKAEHDLEMGEGIEAHRPTAIFGGTLFHPTSDRPLRGGARWPAAYGASRPEGVAGAAGSDLAGQGKPARSSPAVQPRPSALWITRRPAVAVW
jgi:hypothetical protein